MFKPKNITLDEWHKDAPNLLRLSSIQTYNEIINTHLMPVLDDRYLTSIINNSIKVRHNTINTTSGILRLMRSLFNYAIDKKYINKSNDPTQDKARLKIKKPRLVYCLPQEEIDAIFDRFKNTRLLLGYRCGLRKV